MVPQAILARVFDAAYLSATTLLDGGALAIIDDH
jgi:hypothetical protein